MICFHNIFSNNRLNPEGAKYLGKCLAKNQGLETLLVSFTFLVFVCNTFLSTLVSIVEVLNGSCSTGSVHDEVKLIVCEGNSNLIHSVNSNLRQALHS